MTNLNDSIWTPEDPETNLIGDGPGMQWLCIAPNGECTGSGDYPGLVNPLDCPIGG